MAKASPKLSGQSSNASADKIEVAMPDNLRGGLSDLINTLNKIRNNTTDPAMQAKIQSVLRVLFALWDEVIRQQIDNSTSDYKAAIKSLGDAESDCQAAMTDIKQVAKGVNSAVSAAKAVDKIVKLLVAFA